MAPSTSTKRSGRANSKKAAPRSSATSDPASQPPAAPALFEVDTVGSSTVRHALLRDHAKMRKGASFNKPLKSDEILAARSTVSALTSRVVPSAAARVKREQHKAHKLDRATKERLKRIVGRDGTGQGLWGLKSSERSLPTQFQEGLAGSYDAWQAPIMLNDGEVDVAMQQTLRESSGQLRPKAPPSLRFHSLLGSCSEGPRSVPLPHPGMSYNPAHAQHQSLLSDVLSTYTTLEAREERGQPVKDALDRMRVAGQRKEVWEMYEDEVGSGEDDEELTIVDPDMANANTKKRLPKRKTRQQRNRKILAREEEAKLAERRASKKRIASVLSAPSVNAAIVASRELSLVEKAAAIKLRKARLARQGLTRFRLGPLKVPDAPVTFQLGEELSDNLRTLRPEGNLWKEWVGSNMRRGRVPVERANESKKGGKRGGRGHDKDHKTKVVEKYAFKNWVG